VGGAFGAVATGVFATTAVNAAAFDGLLAGNPGQLVTQLLGVAVVGAYSAVATAAILFLVNLVTPIRVAGDVEETGLDLAQHGEVAYQP
jgi:Amt family ammonium transporter